MKALSLCYALLLLAAEYSVAQAPVVRKIIYKVSLTDSSHQQAKGYLFNITDSSVKVGVWPAVFGDPQADLGKYKETSYQHISEVSLKRNHGAGRGAWKGAVIGALTGVIAGFVEGDDPPEYWFGMTAGEKAITYGGLGAAVGTGIGALVGALAKKHFIIGGRKEKFDEMKANVLNKVYGNSNTR